MNELLNTPLGRFRILACIEGISFLVLFFITMPLKYLMDMPMPNKIFGMGHGILFIGYVVQVFNMQHAYKWTKAKTFWALIASVVPFGTFYADMKLFRD